MIFSKRYLQTSCASGYSVDNFDYSQVTDGSLAVQFLCQMDDAISDVCGNGRPLCKNEWTNFSITVDDKQIWLCGHRAE